VTLGGCSIVVDANSMNNQLFRWSIWGDVTHVATMLSHSIGTFRHFFGDRSRYVVVADDPRAVERSLRVPAEVIDVREHAERHFDDPASTWRKWSPTCRLDPDSTEFYVDADVFLLAEPVEIWEFCARPQAWRFLCTTEPFGTGFYGNFAAHVDPTLPLVNAGFIGQQPRTDLTADLKEQYDWWRRHVSSDAVQYHDEQGAVRKALEPHLKADQVALLGSDRYRVVCPLNEPPVVSLEGVVLLHATFPHRPAFWQFHDEIAAVSGVV
jgi:hypothetical protein